MGANITKMVNFIWSIADDCLVNIYVKGKYRDVILPMMVIRRLDAVLEKTHDDVMKAKQRLIDNGFTKFDSLTSASKQAFYNTSEFTLKKLASITNKMQLKLNFEDYLNGFSDNVQEIIDKFKFRDQIPTLSDKDILGSVIEKFVSNNINLSNEDVVDENGKVLMPALDNHDMGTVFEELLRRFNEENSVTEAGEHFTPRDIVELMADLAFEPIKDSISDGTYLVYDGACGTGGILTVADARLKELAKLYHKKLSINIYGQELQDETYATCKSDLLIKGEGTQADNIFCGSTISNDGFSSMTFDFMISNPPFGTPWKKDIDVMTTKGKKEEITDYRFVTSFKDQADYSMLPNVGDPQLLFLLNNVSKMKHTTTLGSRIVEVHNGSALFTGEADSGESNARRYIIENDYLEAIIALPNNIFYNTGIGTYLWVLSNRKAKCRKGKIQLIDASSFKKSLRKKLGERSFEITEELRRQILNLYFKFEDNEYSKIFNNEDFGFTKITIEHPILDENNNPILKKGKMVPNADLRDSDSIPFNEDIDEYFKKNILPFDRHAWMDRKKDKIGYQISFNKYFSKFVEPEDYLTILNKVISLTEEETTIVEELKKHA